MPTPRVVKSVLPVIFGFWLLSACGTNLVEPEANSSLNPEILTSPSPLTSAPPEETNERLAWEALLGPDGEYAAIASYQAVIDTYGAVEPYTTILQAELRHANALTRQLNRFGIEVPQNPYLGKVEAPASLTTAAQAWAEGEVLNVEMYDQLIKKNTDPRLDRIFNNLRRASLESHLPLFEKAAANGGTLTLPIDYP